MVKKNKGLNDSIDNTVKNITNFIEDNFWILFILLLIIPSVVTTILYPMFTSFDKTITIKKKYTRTRMNKKCIQYQILFCCELEKQVRSIMYCMSHQIGALTVS